jgi:hypothetical protein
VVSNALAAKTLSLAIDDLEVAAEISDLLHE